MIRWGIAGTGRMAAAMASVIDATADGEVCAVGSATPGRAGQFAAEHGVDRAHDSLLDVARDEQIDALYVAGTNDTHHQVTLAALASGTPVLCEKPLTLDRGRAAEMVAASTDGGVFLMEAMWMAFQPWMPLVRGIIAGGAIGEITNIQVDFGFPHQAEPDGRLMSPALGGGSLLDIGIYPLTLIHMFAGVPDHFETVAVPAATGVDLQAAVIGTHPGGVLSAATSSLEADTTLEAVIAGRGGRIRMQSPFHQATVVTVEQAGSVVARHEVPDEGYVRQVEEVHRCIGSGLMESPVRPHADTLAVMGWMDDIRSRIGVRYPGE